MDKTIRRNTNCVIGMPRCDFVFSSTRTCFIGYAFEDSHLEMRLISRLLEERGIQAVEAAGQPAPGQNAFCAKICSKIITSQFCVAIVNNTEKNGIEVPNANVNMEYGLMLGFNKYVIPFQKKSQQLPFNTAPLDTIKYTNSDLERRASEAIDIADVATRQDSPPAFSADQIIEAFLLAKRSLISPTNDVGHQNVYRLGAPLGFNLLNDFAGANYMYFGNFTALRREVILWRIRTLVEIINERRAAVTKRLVTGTSSVAAMAYEDLMKRIQIWILVTTQEDKSHLSEELRCLAYKVSVFCVDDIRIELENIGKPTADQANESSADDLASPSVATAETQVGVLGGPDR